MAFSPPVNALKIDPSVSIISNQPEPKPTASNPQITAAMIKAGTVLSSRKGCSRVMAK